MQWYQFSPTLMLPFDFRRQAYEYAIQTNLEPSKIHPVTIERFRLLDFLNLIRQILHYCERGHSLQNAILEQSPTRQKYKAGLSLRALQYTLSQGGSVGNSLSHYAPIKVAPLLRLIPQDSPEESKIAALKVVQQTLEAQQSLTQQLLKSLSYPFLVIQSAIMMAFVNTWLAEANSGTILGLWLLTTIGQLYLYFWLRSGSAYSLLARYITSFRIYNLLILIEALLKAGEPLQTIIQKLAQDAQGREQTDLYQTHLKLLAGKSADLALPSTWFINSSKALLENISRTGDLPLAVRHAAWEWQKRNQAQLTLLSKVSPVVGLIIAASFVSYALLQLYAPLMEVNRFVE